MSLLDEECVFPQGTDQSYLAKLIRQCANHQYFKSDSKALSSASFAMEHYAGTVRPPPPPPLDSNPHQPTNQLTLLKYRVCVCVVCVSCVCVCVVCVVCGGAR
jgi:hypothetical protein